MKKYQISNRQSGVDLGVYEGLTAQDALDAMAHDAGYIDHADAERQVPDVDGAVVVTEVADESKLSRPIYSETGSAIEYKTYAGSSVCGNCAGEYPAADIVDEDASDDFTCDDCGDIFPEEDDD